MNRYAKRLSIVIILAIFLTNFLQPQSLDNLPPHGYGFLERVINKTDYYLSMYYEKHPTFDAVPENTVIRIKSRQNGKYYTLRKTDDKKIIFKADTTDANDYATQFTVHQRMSGNLQPWIGIAHPNAQDKMMGISPTDRTVIFNVKSQDFSDENTKTSHWNIKGDSIENCFLENRETGGPLSPYVGKIAITTEVKPKSFVTATAQWALSFRDQKNEFINRKVIEAETNLNNQINTKKQERDRIKQEVENEIAQYPVGAYLQADTGSQRPARAVHFTDGNFNQSKKWYQGNCNAPHSMRIKESIDSNNGYFSVHPPYAPCNGCDNWPAHPSGKSCEGLVWSSWRLRNNNSDAPAAGDGNWEQIAFFDVGSNEKITDVMGLPEGRIVAIYSVHHQKFLKCYKFTAFGDKNVGLKAIGESKDEPWCQFRIHTDNTWAGNRTPFFGIQLIEPPQIRSRIVALDNEIARLEQTRPGIIENAKKIGFDDFQRDANAKIFAFRNNIWNEVPGDLIYLTVQNDNIVWGCNTLGELWQWENGTWKKTNIRNFITCVSVGSQGDVWCIDRDHKIWMKKAKERDFAHAPKDGLDDTNLIQLSVRNENETWGVGLDNRGRKSIYKFDTFSWKKNSPPDTQMVMVSVADNGAVWALDDRGQAWTCANQTTWKAVSGCSDILTCIAARNDNDVYGVSDKREMWHWNGSNWENQKGGQWDFVALASGVTEIPAEMKTEYKTFEGVSTQDKDGKALPFGDEARIQIEVVKLGMGGGIEKNSSFDFVKIPVTKKPRVAGFANDRIENFDSSALITINPLINKGVAWLETALKTPGKTAVSFLANSKDTGDIQVLFGQSISNSFVWRIRIGCSSNVRSAIERRRYQGNESFDDVVYEVTRDQNPIAATFPGNFTPYWVSIENGLILVGMGDYGDNIFMAWRDPNPPSDVNRVGFGSNSQSVQYAQIQLGQPVVAQKPQRIYVPNKTIKTTESINVSPSKDSFTWSAYPFRIPDNGTVYFEIKGTEKVVLALSCDPINATNHYAIIFGDTNTSATSKGVIHSGISIKKWYKSVKNYIEKAFIGEDSYPAIKLDPNAFKKFWVSFLHGQIIVGQGEIGQNIITVFQDVAPFDSIDAIGFAACGSVNAQIKNIQIASATSLMQQKQDVNYKVTQASLPFTGAITVILPFEYKFSQENQNVKLEDLVNHTTFYPAATPQQGALYAFLLNVLPNGAPELKGTTAPENDKAIAWQRAILKTTTAADLARAQAELDDRSATIVRSMKDAEIQRITSLGELEKEMLESQAAYEASIGTSAAELKRADAQKARAKYEAEMGTAKLISETGATVMGMGSQGGAIGAAAASVIGIAMTAEGFRRALAAEGRLQEAATKDFEGAQLEAQAKKTALSAQEQATKLEIVSKQKAVLATEQATLVEAQMRQKIIARQSDIAQLDFNAKIMQGEANFAFRAHDSYVYVDTPERPALGSGSIPEEAKENQSKILELLDQADGIYPGDEDRTYALIATCQKIIYKITHFYVVNSQEIKQRIFSNFTKLIKVSDQFTKFSDDIIKLLFAGFNNSFLVNETLSAEANIKDNWLNVITSMVRAQIKANNSILLDAFCGEYVWLPQELPKPSQGTVTFEVKGNNDLFICFATDFRKKTRNSLKDLYEIVLGGWANTRHSLRIQSLGKSVREINLDEDPSLSLNPQESELYWITIKDGTITVGKGDIGNNILLAWKDPYPIPNLKYIGLSSWDSPVSVKNIKVTDTVDKPSTKATKTKAPAKTTKTATTTKKIAPVKTTKGIGTSVVKQSIDTKKIDSKKKTVATTKTTPATSEDALSEEDSLEIEAIESDLSEIEEEISNEDITPTADETTEEELGTEEELEGEV